MTRILSENSIGAMSHMANDTFSKQSKINNDWITNKSGIEIVDRIN